MRFKECKVIFLGDRAVGKTTTIRRICGDGELIGIRETPGIEIRSATLNPDGSVGDRGDPDGIRVHFWDFSGQDVLRPIHRCFLTESTVYVIVSNASQFDHVLSQSRAVYWLDFIRDFAQNRDSEGRKPSRVLLLMNCQENDVDRFDLNDLRAGFSGCSNLQFADNDCNLALDVVKAGEEDVRNIVRQIYTAAQDFVDEYPRSWFRLRDSLERETEEENYLDAKRYRTLCKRCGVPKKEAEKLLENLAKNCVVFRSKELPFRTGNAIHKTTYSRRNSNDYMVLRSIWLINAVYAIISCIASHRQTENDTFSIDDLAKLLKNHKAFSTLDPKTKSYGEDEVYCVMDVMVQRGLAKRTKTGKYLIRFA